MANLTQALNTLEKHGVTCYSSDGILYAYAEYCSSDEHYGPFGRWETVEPENVDQWLGY